MFFNLGPFGFGFDQQPPRRLQQQQQIRNNQGGNGMFGGFTDFLQEQFMNPFFQPPNR